MHTNELRLIIKKKKIDLNNYCEIYRKDDYIREYYVKDTQNEEITHKLYCYKFDFDGDTNKCVYQWDIE